MLAASLNFTLANRLLSETNDLVQNVAFFANQEGGLLLVILSASQVVVQLEIWKVVELPTIPRFDWSRAVRSLRRKKEGVDMDGT